MTPKKIESVRKTMQAQLDAQKAAIELWRAGDPTRERIIPQPWELTEFLMAKVKKNRQIAEAAIYRHRVTWNNWYPVDEDLLRLWERSL